VARRRASFGAAGECWATSDQSFLLLVLLLVLILMLVSKEEEMQGENAVLRRTRRCC
jgi:hypothetical protein